MIAVSIQVAQGQLQLGVQEGLHRKKWLNSQGFVPAKLLLQVNSPTQLYPLTQAITEPGHQLITRQGIAFHGSTKKLVVEEVKGGRDFEVQLSPLPRTVGRLRIAEPKVLLRMCVGTATKEQDQQEDFQQQRDRLRQHGRQVYVPNKNIQKSYLCRMVYELGHLALFFASFLAATILPFSSEIMLSGMLAAGYDPA